MEATPSTSSLARLPPRELRKLLPGLGSARTSVRNAWRRGLRRDAPLKPSEWAEKYRVVAEGTSNHPGKWHNSRTPFLVEIMDCMAPTHPARRITFMKSAQVSGSEGISNIICWIIDSAPGPVLVVHPTIEAARDWTVEKFEPTIEATRRVGRKIRNVVIRGRDGSTLKRKLFPGGSVVLTGANSAAGLRQKSVKTVILDDMDEFPSDVGGQGDPVRMARARKTSFERSGQDKELDVSTPTVKSVSRIAKQYEAGTQARWHVPCPHCGAEQVLKWGGRDKPFGIKFNPTAPYHAHYICEANGCIVEHWQLDGMNARGRWIHAMPLPGREPSYHISALNSPFTTWDHMVAKWVEAQGNPAELKTFINLELGEPWDEAADRPKARDLLDRRETWPQGTCPDGVLFITLGGDVQGDGIWYTIVGWGRDRQSWNLEKGFLAGDPGVLGSECWQRLARIERKTFRDDRAVEHPIDGSGIDARYQTDVVVEWCKKAPGRYAVRGEEGWKVPAWLGRPNLRESTERGKARRRGPKTFPVGTWTLKQRFYAQLKLKKEPDAPGYPAAYCHFSQDWSEDDFTQLLSEVFVTQRDRKTGKVRSGWHVVEADNHLLDARIYAEAIAEKEGLSKKSPAEWDWLERKWLRLADEQRTLFDTPALADPAPPVTESALERRSDLAQWSDTAVIDL